MNVYKCEGCKLFEDKPGKLNPLKENDGDWIGWCHLNKGNLLILRSTYDLICYFGCASHSDFQSGHDKVLDELYSRVGIRFNGGFGLIPDLSQKNGEWKEEIEKMKVELRQSKDGEQ